MKRILLTALLGLLAAPSWALVFTVTNTNNSGPGSFRQAVQDANTTPGPDQVEFNIAGPAPHVINLLSPVTFTDNQTTVDGTTQPANGYTGPSPHIVLQGQVTTGQEGLSIEGDGVALYGLYVRNFQYFGISVETTADNYVIGAPGRGNVISGNGYEGLSIHGHNGTVQANIIGLEPDGTTPEPNGYYGISFERQASFNVIGGTTAGERNIVSANEYDGIGFGGNCTGGGGDHNIIIGNYIGTDITGTLNRGNNYHGINIQATSQYNIIGGSTPDSANLIAYNAYGAIEVDGVWTGICGSSNAEFNSIGINTMTCNDGPGINLRTNFFSGLTGNQGYAAPTVTSATPTQVTGTANPGDIIHIYNDDACPACQGEVYIGSAVADGLGNWVFNGSGISLTTSVIATATGPNGNTSEFSTCALPPAPCITVNVTGPADLCANETGVLTTNVPPSLATFSWTTGSVDSFTTITGPGNYQVTVTQPGCPPADEVQTVSYTVNPKLSLNVDAGPDVTQCVGSSVNLDATTPNAVSYIWTDVGSGSTVATSAVCSPTASGTYAVVASAPGYCSDSDTVVVNIVGLGGTNGVWTGAADGDWTNCLNWDDGQIPGPTTNVLIDDANTVNPLDIGTMPASTTVNDFTLNTADPAKNPINPGNTPRELQVDGTLNLVNGYFQISAPPFTNANITANGFVFVSSGNANDVQYTNGFIYGRLFQISTGNTGIYNFPIGNPTEGLNLAQLDFLAPSDHLFIGGAFRDDLTPVIPPAIANSTECGQDGYSTVLGNYLWRLDATNPSGSTPYNVILHPSSSFPGDYTPNSGDRAATIMKSDFSATPGGHNWALAGSCAPGLSSSNLNGPNPIVTRTGLTSFSDFTIILDADDPFPVEWLEFSAERRSATEVALSWATAAEQNNEGFYVERSFNGESFEEIDFVAGGGTTTQAVHYNLLDNQATPDRLYYRLRQRDFDGRVSYSNVLEVAPLSGSTPGDFSLQLYPNPFRNSLQLHTDLPPGTVTQLELYSVAGKRLFRVEGEAEAVAHALEQKSRALAAGVYLLQVEARSHRKHLKIVKQ